MKALYTSAAGLLRVTVLASLAGASVGHAADLTDLPPNTWVEIKYTVEKPSDNPDEKGSFRPVGWNKIVYDPDGKRVLFYDRWVDKRHGELTIYGNCLFALDPAAARLTPVKIDNWTVTPTKKGGYRTLALSENDKVPTPCPRHVYHAFTYVPGVKAVLICGRHDGTVAGGCLPRGALEVWRQLPERERKPGALVIPEQTVRDRIVAQLPPGGLILKVHQSALHRDAKGELRRQAHQYPEEYGTKLKYEPGHDYVWLTPAQWKLLVPGASHKGDRLALPVSITEQIAYHLRDSSRHGGSFPSVTWTAKDLRSQDLKLIVDEVATVLRLEGPIHLQETLKEPGKGRARFDGHLLGYLDYDTRKKAFVRMDVAVLGEFQGWHWVGSSRGGLKLTDPYTLGVSFELRDVSLAPPSNWHCRGK